MKPDAFMYIDNKILKIIDNIHIDKEKCTLSFEYTQAEKNKGLQCTLKIINNNESSHETITKQHNTIALKPSKDKPDDLNSFDFSIIARHQNTMTTLWHHIETIDFSNQHHKVCKETEPVETIQNQYKDSKLWIDDHDFIKTWQKKINDIVNVQVKAIFDKAINQDFIQKVVEKLTGSIEFVQIIKRIQYDIFNKEFYEKLAQQILSEKRLADMIVLIFEKKWAGLKQELVDNVFSRFKEWHQNSINQLIQSNDLSKVLSEIKVDIIKCFEINFTNDIVDRIQITERSNSFQENRLTSVQQYLENKIVESNERTKKELNQKIKEQEQVFEKIVQYATKSAMSEFFKGVHLIKSKLLDEMIQLNTKIETVLPDSNNQCLFKISEVKSEIESLNHQLNELTHHMKDEIRNVSESHMNVIKMGMNSDNRLSWLKD